MSKRPHPRRNIVGFGLEAPRQSFGLYKRGRPEAKDKT